MKKGLVYEVCHKDDTVFTISSGGEVFILDESKMPFDIYVEESKDIDDLANNIVNFNSWCAERIIPLDRKYAKEILAYYGFDNASTLSERADIGIATRCLSINDCFWVKEINEDITWAEVNLYDNSLNNAIFELPLIGKGFTLEKNSISPDINTDGKAPKAWMRNGNDFYLLKKDNGTDAVIKEVEASKILQKLGINAIDYNYQSFKDYEISSCKCFTDKNTHMVKAHYYAIYSMNYNDDFDLDLQTKFKKDFDKMIIADYLIGNPDRHAFNWGLLYGDDMEIKSLAPIYDFDHAFEAENVEICQPYHFIGRHILLEDAAKIILSENPSIIDYDTDLSEFKYGKFVEERLNLLKDYLIDIGKLEPEIEEEIDRDGYDPGEEN